MTDVAQLLQTLNRQQQTLELILNTLERPKLGFHSDAGTIFVYCNRSRDSLWYTLDNGNPVPITHNALTGYLRSLKFEKCIRRGKEVWKLVTRIEADRGYSLESGHDSHFSKGLMAAVATLTIQQLMQPITIQPVPGDDESVLFCRVWLGTEQVQAPYSNDTDWRATAKLAIANVQAANDMPF